MFNDLLLDSANVILVSRLSRILPLLANANYSTLEEFRSNIYSQVNKILVLQNSMQPLVPIKRGTPVLLGGLTDNMTNLNNDCSDIISQILAVENDAANLFNLAELSQTSIRQKIREQIFINNSSMYSENFINKNNIQNTTATLDFTNGTALLPLVNEVLLKSNIALGISSIGSSTSNLSSLSDQAVDTSYIWSGKNLELIFNFANAAIVNRLVIDLDTYDGLEIISLTSSPDGNIYNDILASINVANISLNSTIGKYSGAVTIDFPPQYAQTIKLIISNVIGQNNITLRNINFYSRQYSSSAQLTSNLISNPVGQVLFSQVQLLPTFTNIIHQYSYDNVHFNNINSTSLDLTGPYWYRALLSRSTTQTNSSGLVKDPSNSTYYTLSSSTTLNLGNNITERTIVLTNITGPIVLSETPLPNSLKLQVNSILLNISQYTFVNNIIILASNQSNLTIIYQTTSLNNQTLTNLQNYYTPILSSITFEA